MGRAYADIIGEKLDGYTGKVTDDDIGTYYRVRDVFAKQEVRERLIQYAEDGWQVFIDADDFQRLAWDYQEQVEAFGDEYISDWFHDESVKRGILVEA